MTKREFIKLKEGDVVLAIRHIFNEKGQIAIAENSEWEVKEIALEHFKGQGRKPMKTALIENLSDYQQFTLTKKNSPYFMLVKAQKSN
jgi:hypothetical protein